MKVQFVRNIAGVHSSSQKRHSFLVHAEHQVVAFVLEPQTLGLVKKCYQLVHLLPDSVYIISTSLRLLKL